MGVRALAWAFRSQRTPFERLVLLALADFADDEGACWPGVGTLMERTGMSRRGVHKVLARLEADGLLAMRERHVPGGRQTSNVYVLDLDWEPPVPVAAGAAGAAAGDSPAVAGMPDPGGGGCTGCTPPEEGRVHRVHGGGCTGCTPEGAPGAPLELPEELPERTLSPNSRSDGELFAAQPENGEQPPQPDIEAQEDVRLARWMFSLVLGLYPKQREPNWAKWRDVVRLMRTRDGHSRREIAELFRWANADPFWQSNILSPAKLREQWPTLWIRRSSAQSNGAARGQGDAAPVVDRRCAWTMAGIRCACAGVSSVGTHVTSPWYCAEHLERVESGEKHEGAASARRAVAGVQSAAPDLASASHGEVRSSAAVSNASRAISDVALRHPGVESAFSPARGLH